MSRNASPKGERETFSPRSPVPAPLQPESSRDSALLLTVSEVGTILHLSRSAVYHLAERRRLPQVKIGATLRFLREDVLRFIQEHRVESRTNYSRQ